MDSDPRRTSERRFSRPVDPSLSEEANRMVDRELADATGVTVLRGPEVPGTTRAGTHSAFVAQVIELRLVLGVSFVVLVLAGLVCALATGAWIVLVGLIGLHAVGTCVVAAGVLQLTTETEHVSPELAARLEVEGVGDADRMFTNLVAEVAGDQERRGPAEVAMPGHDERDVATEHDPARATAQQRTALTPSSRATSPAEHGEVPGIAALPWYVVGAMMVLSVVIGGIEGGAMWIATAIVLFAGVGWIGLDHFARRRLEAAQSEADDAATNRTALVVLGAVVLAVMAFMSLMGLLVAAG